MKKTSLLLFTVFIYMQTSVYAEGSLQLPRSGEIYPVIEKDALQEIKARASSVDMNTLITKEMRDNAVRRYRPAHLPDLPVTSEESIRKIVIEYRLDRDTCIPVNSRYLDYARSNNLLDQSGRCADITGKQGEYVYYPAGYTIVPLKYLASRGIEIDKNYLVIDGDDSGMLELARNTLLQRGNTVILLSSGNYLDVSGTLGVRTFYLTKPVMERFRIRSVPSLIRVSGGEITVREIPVPEGKEKTDE